MYKEAARWLTVRKVLIVMGVVLVSLPLLFVLWLLMAVRMPRMDAVTLKMPMDVRTTVAEAALQNVLIGDAWRKNVTRILTLDPENAIAWGRLCLGDDESATMQANLLDCHKAVSLDASASNWSGLGRAQERAGDECAAEESFTQASSKGSTGTAYYYVENMGRAALRCGKPYDARAGLEAALDLEGRSLKDVDNDDEEVADEKQDQLTDREYLVVTFDRLHDAELAKKACSEAHSDWKGCACSLDAKGKVSCTDAGK